MVDQSIDQQSSDAVNSVENALASLWDKAREASLLISTLREEKKRLIQRIADLDEEVAHLKQLTARQQTQLDIAQLENESEKKSGSISIDIEEKRQLQQKIRNIITKLDQYISP